jgi:hypothetical protein
MAKKDRSRDRTRTYRERLAAKQEAAQGYAALNDKYDLRYFGESAFEHNAESLAEEVHIHRQFLRALRAFGQPDVQDVQPGETLRELARRTWNAYLEFDRSSGWVPLFSAKLQTFGTGIGMGNNWPGYSIPEALKDGWYDANWIPPKDCTGDEQINLGDLPELPPIRAKTK